MRGQLQFAVKLCRRKSRDNPDKLFSIYNAHSEDAHRADFITILESETRETFDANHYAFRLYRTYKRGEWLKSQVPTP